MAGNAHRRRVKLRATPCPSTCPYCRIRPVEARSQGLPWRNKTGNRHNPTSKRRGKRPKRK